MTWPFRKKKPPMPPEIEDPLDRDRALSEQHRKLRRAQQLKERSSQVAASLQKEARANNYGARLFEAYRLAERNQ